MDVSGCLQGLMGLTAQKAEVTNLVAGRLLSISPSICSNVLLIIHIVNVLPDKGRSPRYKSSRLNMACSGREAEVLPRDCAQSGFSHVEFNRAVERKQTRILLP